MKAILILTIILFVACTGQATQVLNKPISCADTDGGINFEQGGTVVVKTESGYTTTYPDKCKDGQAIETYCDEDNNLRKQTKTCDCVQGICLS